METNFNNSENTHEERLKDDLNKAFEKNEKSVIGFFVRRFRITYLALMVVFLFGFYAIATLPKEAEPEVRVPFAVVTAVYPGANPTDVEDLVIDELEEKIKNLDNLKIYNSSASIGVGSVFVEFEAEADLEDSFSDLKDAVDEAKPNLPEEANDPIVKEINFNDFPIVTYSFVGDYSDIELKKFADRLQAAFENMKDVSKAPILGGLEREFQVLVDQARLSSFGLSLPQVVSAISASNFNMPAGEIDVGNYSYSVRVKGKFENVRDLDDVIIAYKSGAPVYLSSVATVIDGFKDKNTVSKIGIGDSESKNTISIQIFKKTGGNILNIVDNSQDVIDELKSNGQIPSGLEVLRVNDNSKYIKDDIRRLGTSGIQTMILIIILLIVVLGTRGALITGFSIPIAFLIAFIFIMIQGMTINSMVLFSLVLSLGLMVDNSIIVMEGINEYIYKHNKTP